MRLFLFSFRRICAAADAEEMSRLCAYGDSNCGSPWSATISCGEAIPNCDECNGMPVCSKCKSGYVLQDGKCVEQVACPSNCAECDSSGVCTKCDGGYVLKNGACAVKPKTQIAFCSPGKTLTDDLCCCVSKKIRKTPPKPLNRQGSVKYAKHCTELQCVKCKTNTWVRKRGGCSLMLT